MPVAAFNVASEHIFGLIIVHTWSRNQPLRVISRLNRSIKTHKGCSLHPGVFAQEFLKPALHSEHS